MQLAELVSLLVYSFCMPMSFQPDSSGDFFLNSMHAIKSTLNSALQMFRDSDDQTCPPIHHRHADYGCSAGPMGRPCSVSAVNWLSGAVNFRHN
ncbi:unnamed protein product [Protopolystoma xenopodis]|uniref:Uncharacterized protein n=1 Tax=Protopolystoma xenopodis TaxID=117903 RepID=A0A448XJH2_9PLAT|nr:unnamed protein product [Protopolystoma xenopodis]